MSYNSLEEVSGMGKPVTIRDKQTGERIVVGIVQKEESVDMDREQKYFIQLILLEENVSCEGDPTRHVVRIGCYTRRTDGPFCLGSQFAPILTPAERRSLLDGVKDWPELHQ
jgi:hypothetical protein